jgi:sugar phosphate isomerase/epimerase
MRTTSARVLLKCRPTPAQLADRLAPPVPEGLELYLDARDLQGDDWLARTTAVFDRFPRSAGFAVVVEGPLRSLDGTFFDLTADTTANRAVVRRVAALGRALGAEAANVHVIAPCHSAADFGEARRDAALRAALPLLREYARACLDAGLRPLVENIPPVARQREAAFMYTPIGVAAEDLVWLTRQVPDVGVTLDLSHAQLYVNALRLPEDAVPAEVVPVLRDLRSRGGASTLDAYADALGASLVNVHVSNATGLLGEGLPYGEGDADLDAAIARLLGVARYLVTETIEPDPNRAVYMREAQARMASLRGRWERGTTDGHRCTQIDTKMGTDEDERRRTGYTGCAG